MAKHERAHVILDMDEWWDYLDNLNELEHLRDIVKEYRERDREYMQWSLGGGMAKAVLAGMAIGGNEGARELLT